MDARFVPPDDEAALAEAICAAVADPDERKRRGERALAESNRWAWPPIVVRLGAVYEELLLAAGSARAPGAPATRSEARLKSLAVS